MTTSDKTPRSRILILVTRSEFGGVQSHIMELLNGLHDRYELLIASGEEGPLLDAAREIGVRSYHIPELVRPISPKSDWKAFRSIAEILEETKPGLLHCHSSKAGILGRIAARKYRIPSVFTAHGWAFAEGSPITR